MNEHDISKIEEALDISLPSFYRKTMLNYPFKEDSFGEEFLLANNSRYIININSVEAVRPLNDIFYIGTDGGECQYFIRLGEEGGKVYEYSVESDEYEEYSTDWRSYLVDIERVHREIEEDELLQQKIKDNKKWWQFWI